MCSLMLIPVWTIQIGQYLGLPKKCCFTTQIETSTNDWNNWILTRKEVHTPLMTCCQQSVVCRVSLSLSLSLTSSSGRQSLYVRQSPTNCSLVGAALPVIGQKVGSNKAIRVGKKKVERLHNSSTGHTDTVENGLWIRPRSKV